MCTYKLFERLTSCKITNQCFAYVSDNMDKEEKGKKSLPFSSFINGKLHMFFRLAPLRLFNLF